MRNAKHPEVLEVPGVLDSCITHNILLRRKENRL